MWGLAEYLHAKPIAWHLRENLNWKPDISELKKIVSKKTKMIAICNPNNPTGYVLTKSEM